MMISGYTSHVLKDCSFEEFVWECAKCVGVLYCTSIEERMALDGRADADTLEQLETAKRKLERLQSATDEEWAMLAQDDFDRAKKLRDGAFSENDAGVAKFQAMLDKVQAWKPPTKAHEEFKQFMVNQLCESINCNTLSSWHPPELVPVEEFKAAELQRTREEITRLEERVHKETERNTTAAQYLRDLVRSVPPPTPNVVGLQR